MAAMQVPGDFIQIEPGMFDETGRAESFFYYRVFDLASDTLLNAAGLGADARRTINRSTYTATAELHIEEPVIQGERLRFEVVVTRIGGKSVTYRTRMIGVDDGRVKATYDTVGVCMDMTGPTSIPIPDDVRSVLEGYMD